MFSSFWRRPTVALTMVLAILIPVSLIGVQTVAFGTQRTPTEYPVKSHNPTCMSAFGDTVCITATPNGLRFKWTGETYYAGAKYCPIGCGDEDYLVQGPWTHVAIVNEVKWEGSSSHTVFVRLKKPDDYQGFATLIDPAGGYGTALDYTLIVPQVGNSNLAITTTSLPTAKLGVKYLARLHARGGKPPYSWTSVLSLPAGLTLIRTGPKAGTIIGILRQIGDGIKPIIVNDKIGHAAYQQLVLYQVK